MAKKDPALKRALSTTTAVFLIVLITAIGAAGLIGYAALRGVTTTTVCCTTRIPSTSTITTTVSRTGSSTSSTSNYVAANCPPTNETYPSPTPWSSPKSNMTVDITNISIQWLGPASDLDGNLTQPTQYATMKAGQVLYYTIFWSAQPFDYNIDSVYTNTSSFSVIGICWAGYAPYLIALPQQVIEGTNFSFTILLQLPTNSSYTGPVNIYIQSGQKTIGCADCSAISSGYR